MWAVWIPTGDNYVQLTKAQKLFSYIHTIIIYHLQHGRKNGCFLTTNCSWVEQMLDSLEKKKHTIQSLDIYYHYLWLRLQPLLEATERWGLTLVTHSYRLRSMCASPLLYMCGAISETHLLVNTTVNLKHRHILSKLFSHNHLLQNLIQAFGSFRPSLLQQSVISIQLQNPPSLAACHLPRGTAESVNSSV